VTHANAGKGVAVPEIDAGTAGGERPAGYEPPCATDLEVTGGTVEAASMVIAGISS
jgi:hypothetical protein